MPPGGRTWTSRSSLIPLRCKLAPAPKGEREGVHPSAGFSEIVDRTYGGYGTLVTPLGTFQNVARLHDEFNYHITFWNKTPLHPIMIIDPARDGKIWVSVTTAVEDVADDIPLKIYPNPATDRLHVQGLLPGDRYVVYDAVGSMVLQGRSSGQSGPVAIALTDAKVPGMYVLRVERPNGVAMRTFAKV